MSVSFTYPTANDNLNPLYTWEPFMDNGRQNFVCVGNCNVKWTNSSCTQPKLIFYSDTFDVVEAQAIFGTYSSGDTGAILTTWGLDTSEKPFDGNGSFAYLLAMFCNGSVSSNSSLTERFNMHVNNWDYSTNNPSGPETYLYITSTALIAFSTSASSSATVSAVSAITTVPAIRSGSSSGSGLMSTSSSLSTSVSASASALASASAIPSSTPSTNAIPKAAIAGAITGAVIILFAFVIILFLRRHERSKAWRTMPKVNELFGVPKSELPDPGALREKAELATTSVESLADPAAIVPLETPSQLGTTPIPQRQSGLAGSGYHAHGNGDVPARSVGTQPRHTSPPQPGMSVPSAPARPGELGPESVHTTKARERELQRKLEVQESLQRLKAEQAALDDRIRMAEMRAREETFNASPGGDKY